MAGIFDFLNLTPRENTGMTTTGRNKFPQGILQGEYIPRAEGIEDSKVRPRLGVDPVGEQYGSRVDPDAKGRTFYGGRDGNVSTNPEDVRRKPSAHARWTPSGTHPDTPAPKGSGWVPPSESRPDIPKAGKAAGILGKFAKVAGPAGFAFDALNPQMLDDGELTKEQQHQQATEALRNMGPQGVADAVQFGQDLSKRTLDAGMGRTAPVSLMDPQAPQANLFNPEGSPREPAVEDSPVGPVAESAPTTVAQAAATTAQQYEGERQQIEEKTAKGLQTGELSRPKAAEAVVQADAQREGKTLTPEQTKEAVADELTQMKSMDNNQVSKYLSYALVAGGLLGSVLDKSGKTADNFSGAFSKQLDRNLAEGSAQKKAEAAKAKLEHDAKVEAAKLAQGDRKIKQGDIKLEQDLMLGKGNLEVKQGGLKLGYDRLGVEEAQGNARLAQGAQGLSLRQQALQQDASQYEGLMGLKREALDNTKSDTASQIKRREDQTRLGNERTVIAAKKASADTLKGLDVSTNDATDLIKQAAKEAGRDVDKGALAAMAQQVRMAAKNDPRGFAADPSGFVYKLMKSGNYKEEPETFFSKPTIGITQ